MKLNTSIIDYFLDNGHLDAYQSHWIYKAIVPGTWAFECPDPSRIKRLKTVLSLAVDALDHFEPLNLALWESIYGPFKGISDAVCIHLMVGSPDPYDAMVRQSPTGEFCIFFDLERLSQYSDEDDDSLLFTLKNLMTHEVAHIENRKWLKMPSPMASWAAHLAFLTLDEGLAHFLSLRENVTAIDWHGETLRQRKKDVYETYFIEAHTQSELPLSKRLEAASSGSFWQKYAAIAGLFALVDFVIVEHRPLSELKQLEPEFLYEKILNSSERHLTA